MGKIKHIEVGEFEGGSILFNTGKGLEHVMFKPSETTSNDAVVYSFGYAGLPGFRLGMEMGSFFGERGVPVAVVMYDGLNLQSFFDYVGVKLSANLPQDDSQYSFLENIEKIKRVREEVGEGKRVHVAGHSYGVALSLVTLEEGVASFIAINPVYRFGQIYRDFVHDEDGGIDGLMRGGISDGVIIGDAEKLVEEVGIILPEEYDGKRIQFPGRVGVFQGEEDYDSIRRAAELLYNGASGNNRSLVYLTGVGHEIGEAKDRESLFLEIANSLGCSQKR
ncbi:alpha/beta fold hydrolase [Nanoarchaeota archaeon]